MRKIILIVIAFLFIKPSSTEAQKLAFEKTYEITGKAKRGYLDEVEFDKTTQTTKLYFVTRESGNFTGSKTKVKYQQYTFDKEFNFVNMEEKVEEYRNKKYKGETYSVEGVTMENNFVGTFVLRKKLITYTWDWFNGGYRKKVTLMEKVKPSDDSGTMYSLISKFENDATGEVIALVRQKGKGLKYTGDFDMKEVLVLKVTKDLKFEITDRATFPYLQSLVSSLLIPNINNLGNESEAEEGSEGSEGDLSTSDAGFIFTNTSMDKKNGADPHDYTFWHVDANGKIKTKLPFKAGASVWQITDAITNGESIYLMGPANDGKFYDQGISGGVQVNGESNIKWKLFQVAKITGGKLDYNTITNMDEFEEKLKTPPSQKKSPSYSGKKFYFKTASIAGDGSLFISGQNYSMDNGKRAYKDVVMFYFDNAGKLKAQYGVRREENGSDAKLVPAGQEIIHTGGATYWTIYEMDGFKEEKEGSFVVRKPLQYPSIARIDRENASIGDFIQYGTVKNKPSYFLHYNFPVLQVEGNNSIVYLGSSKSGKTLWFGKVVTE